MPLVSELLERWDRDDAKGKFVNCCFDTRDTLQAWKFKEKFKPGQKEDIEALLQRTLDLLNSPQSRFGTEEDFSGMQKELEGVLTPIMMEVYQAAEGGGLPEAATPEAPSHEAAESGEVPEATTPGFSEGND